MSASQPSTSPRPVIVITGGNSGVGFGIAQRFLVQLSSPTPTDTVPVHPSLATPDQAPLATPFAAPNGCTLVLACRNAIKAHRARAQLMSLLQWLEDLPEGHDENILSVPPAVLEAQVEGRYGTTNIDEDADPAMVVQAMEASIRRRKKRAAAAVTSSARGNSAGGGDESESSISSAAESLSGDRDPTRDPRTGKDRSLREREARARARYRRRFCQGTKVEFVPIDLGSMSSALACAREVTQRYGYVTHVVLNAGGSAFTGINWPAAIWLVLTRFHAAVTYPSYKLQRQGDIGRDGYGWVWQANIGAHYILTRALLPALRATPYSTPSRIIWTGSIEATEDTYDPSDYQSLDTTNPLRPYEASKYQCELMALGLEDLLTRARLRTVPSTPLGSGGPQEGRLEERRSDDGKRLAAGGQVHGGIEPKSFLSHPGVVASSIFADYLNFFLSACMKLAFYIARWTFSDHHNIEGYKGAVAAVHVGLAPLTNLDPSIRYGARSDWWAREYVHSERVDGWDRKEPTGIGREAKHSVAPTGEDVEEGDYVMGLARDLVRKCEGVAGKVWKEAREGALPPFSDLVENRKGTESSYTLSGDFIDEKTKERQERRSKRATEAILQEGLLPDTADTASTSLSSQESWEKVDEAV